MKYLVMVNQKYLVMVEANSAGGAEHRILDEVYHGIVTCQAFTLNELGTDFFATYAEQCETISFAEMMEKASCYQSHLEMIAEEKAKIERFEKEMERHEYEIKIARENAHTSRNAVANLEANITNIW